MTSTRPMPTPADPARRPSRRRPAALGLALFVTLSVTLLSGCAQTGITWGVEPWERDLLAKPAMQPGGDALQGAYDDHIYFSKEAATGGRGFGGGGCGCN